MNPNDIQIGGAHYRTNHGLQHWDLIDKYNVGYLEGVATKYLTRHRRKDGLRDVQKCLHFIQKLASCRRDMPYAEQSARMPRVPYPVIADYLRDNACGPRESEAITLLLTWRATSSLSLAEEIVKQICVGYDAEDASGGYVNQDR
jgi:hypothetical protein